LSRIPGRVSAFHHNRRAAELLATSREAPEHVHVIAGPHDVAQTEVRDPDRVVWLSQTTLALDEVNTTVAALRQRFPRLVDPPSDDICYAAQNRQAGARRLARECDLVLVVGSANSHNSGRLVDVARAAGAPAAHLIEGPEQLVEAR
jgi:4-hydroxy-3-methylbut-2-enyl diphosphate reductase